MDRILLFFQNPGNRRLLADWLSKSYQVIQAESPLQLTEAFDLCIVDTLALSRYLNRIQRRKQDEQPTFLPVLLLTGRQDLGMSVQNLWQSVDELLISPVEKLELQARVEILLRARRLSRQNVLLRRQVEADLARAGKVQSALLPGTSLSLPGFELAARCIPTKEVGGDFYDWQEPVSGVLTLTLADVMGKGMAAALLMATVRASLRALALLNPPATALQLAQAALAADFERSGSFVTLFQAQLNVETRQMTYADAGHGHVFLRRADGTLEELSCRGLPLGVLAEERYEDGCVTFGEGDVMVLHSDGLVETHRDRVVTNEDIAAQLEGSQSAQDMVDRLVAMPKLEGPPPDDLTVVVLRCVGKP